MARTNEELVRELIKSGHLKTPRIIEAFRSVDRADFVPDDIKERAYNNEPLPIGFEQTISQPLTVAFMLELLQPEENEAIIDIGSGSGWQTALLAYIAGRNVLDLEEPVIETKIVALERISELEKFARKNLEKYKLIEKGIVELAVSDAIAGVPEELMSRYGFNKIISAASGSEIPLIWKRQLAVNGRIVAPVGETIVVIDKLSNENYKTEEYHGFRFVSLQSGVA